MAAPDIRTTDPAPPGVGLCLGGLPWRRIGGLPRLAPVTVGSVVALWLTGGVTGALLTGPRSGLREVIGVGLPTLGAGWSRPSARTRPAPTTAWACSSGFASAGSVQR